MPKRKVKKFLPKIDDPNITLDDAVRTSDINGLRCIEFSGVLTYRPESCPICGQSDPSLIIRHGTKTGKIRLPDHEGDRVILRLRKQRFLCKACRKTFSAETTLVDRFCSISNDAREELAELN